MVEPGTLPASSHVAFPSYGHGASYVIPARSRTGSTVGGDVSRKVLRTLSTVSIHESVEGLPGGLAGIAPIGKYIVQKQSTEADAPPSEMPKDFRFGEVGQESGSDRHEEKRENQSVRQGKQQEKNPPRRGKFHLDSA